MKSYFMVSDSDGGLYDTRPAGWSAGPPVRANYARHHRDINSVADLKATLRAGPYMWPGGYPLYFLASGGEALSFDSVRRELGDVMQSIRTRSNDGWRVVACDVNYEDSELYCAHSGERIESAYGEESE